MGAPRGKRLSRAGTAAALTVALAVLGCGGGGSAESRAAFVKQADTVCADGKQQFQKAQATPPESARQAEQQTAKLVALTQAELKRLRALKPPGELRADYDAYLKARQDAVAVLLKGQLAAKRNDPQGYASAKDEIARGQADRSNLARKVGLNVCSKPQARAAGAQQSG
ncbi:MAG: hypothetical protein QOJ38_1369 [Solirubrobacterales bacterium]|jgi:hypothetical protein|nr:hypothetical protein [Solirubrobacterales bacterium]